MTSRERSPSPNPPHPKLGSRAPAPKTPREIWRFVLSPPSTLLHLHSSTDRYLTLPVQSPSACEINDVTCSPASFFLLFAPSSWPIRLQATIIASDLARPVVLFPTPKPGHETAPTHHLPCPNSHSLSYSWQKREFYPTLQVSQHGHRLICHWPLAPPNMPPSSPRTHPYLGSIAWFVQH
jgi:hypothetical protein